MIYPDYESDAPAAPTSDAQQPSKPSTGTTQRKMSRPLVIPRTASLSLIGAQEDGADQDTTTAAHKIRPDVGRSVPKELHMARTSPSVTRRPHVVERSHSEDSAKLLQSKKFSYLFGIDKTHSLDV